MKQVKSAVFGTGFMGRVHVEGARRLGNVEIAAVAGSTAERARSFAESAGIDRSSGDYHEILADPTIEVVHICTPNSLHAPMALDAMRAGKHVICEKPLATTIDDAKKMIALAKERNLRNCTFHNIRFYPQVQNMRCMIAAGELGDVWVVQGTYSQDWLLYDSDWNWRIETGPSRTFADIGTHWCDLTEHVTGLKIAALSSDLHTFHKTRKKPNRPVETFSAKSAVAYDYENVTIQTEDFGSMLFDLGDAAKGAMTVSQISAGRKNRLFLEIYGSKSSVAWDAERPDELWIGHRDKPNQIVVKDPSLLEAGARSYADLPGGHSEGYDDTFKQLLRRFYLSVTDPAAPVDYPTFEDGIRQLRILDAVLESTQSRSWVQVL